MVEGKVESGWNGLKMIQDTPYAKQLSNSDLDFPTNFQSNATKIAKFGYGVGFWLGGKGSCNCLKISQATPLFHLKCSLQKVLPYQVSLKLGKNLRN